MLIETVRAETRPMLYVTRSANLQPQAMADVMAGAFTAMHAFVEENHVKPAGPPLVFYHDWNMATGTIKLDLGYPVAPSDTLKAKGEVHAGQTPSGKALRAVHRGPYTTIPDTYRQMTMHMEKTGTAMPPTCWEVYLNDPQQTREEDLLTEIYFPVP